MVIYDNTGKVIIDIEVDDASVRYQAIQGENSLTLKYSLAEHMEIPVGSYCIFKNETYILMQPEDLTMVHRRAFEYTLVMNSEDARSKMYKFVNLADGRLKFSLTAKPIVHLQLFVDNMNKRDGNGYWNVGECPDHVDIVLSYNHIYCHDALVQLANELKIDYWYSRKNGKRYVNLGKLELNKDNPLPLSYGGDGQGLKPNIKRQNYSEKLPLEILYVQGGSQNIDRSRYGSSELHLPKLQTIGYDGICFEGEDGFNVNNARYYTTDVNGYSISRSDKEVVNHSEDSLDCSDIEPTKTETVAKVVEADKEQHFFDIFFESNVDYSKYVIEGEKATVIFQSDMLAGKEFDLATDENGNLICKQENGLWRVEVVPQTIDGIIMPDTDKGFIPVAGTTTFKVFGIQLPDEYIADNETKTGAEWEMFKYAVKYMYENEAIQYTISGELDEIYAKKNWVNIEGRLNLGNYISFTDKSFQEEPLLIRIIGIKEYVNKPHSPVLEISNAAISGSLISDLNKLENNEVYTETLISSSKQFTKRTFSDVKRSIAILEEAFGDKFEKSIRPATVQTMMMLVGDESLQFAFSDKHNEYFDVDSRTFHCDAGTLIHYTLDVVEIRSKLDQNYHRWSLNAFDSAVLEEKDTEYYVYAVVKKDGDTGDFLLEPTYISMRERVDTEGVYYLLLGLLLGEIEGSRTYMPLYGFTQVLPGQITTDVIRSADGSCYFDLANNEIGGAIKFLPGTSGIENLGLEVGGQNMLRNSGFTGDYLSEQLADDRVLTATDKMFNPPLVHWEATNVEVVEDAESASGYAASMTSGSLKQTLSNAIIAGETYVLSFKAKGTSLLYYIGKHQPVTISLTDEWKYYSFQIKASFSTNEFEISGTNSICEVQLERGTVATGWSNSPFDNRSDRAYYQALEYLASALEGSTTVNGGLVLTRDIRVGDYANQTMTRETGGMRGVWNSDDDIYQWGGGNYDQAVATVAKFKDNPTYKPTQEELKAMANYVVTHGGLAILNNAIVRGTIYSDKGNFSGEINATQGSIGGFEIANDRIGNSQDSSKNGMFLYDYIIGFKESSENKRSYKAYVGTSTLAPSLGQRALAYFESKSTNEADVFNTAYGVVSSVSGYMHNYAYCCPSGVFAGLRPNIRVIDDAADATLTEYDHTIISNVRAITLPSNPQKGQTYRIWFDWQLIIGGEEFLGGGIIDAIYTGTEWKMFHSKPITTD